MFVNCWCSSQKYSKANKTGMVVDGALAIQITFKVMALQIKRQKVMPCSRHGRVTVNIAKNHLAVGFDNADVYQQSCK